MKVVALTIGDQRAGSSWYRVYQYRSYLEGLGVYMDVVPKAEVSRRTFEQMEEADVVINQKIIWPRSMYRMIRRHSRKLVFDYDDAIYTRPGRPYHFLTQWRLNRRLKQHFELSDLILPANKVLAQRADACADKVRVLPMAVDSSLWCPSEMARGGKDTVLGWAGAPKNLPYLQAIDSALCDYLSSQTDVRLAIFSGQKPELASRFSYTPYHPDAQVGFCQGLDVGLLPLPDEAYSHGKSPIKALQYLACGVPVVGNFVGASREIVSDACGLHVETPAQWVEAIDYLAKNPDVRRKMGVAGRAVVEKQFDLKVCGDCLAREMISISC